MDGLLDYGVLGIVTFTMFVGFGGVFKFAMDYMTRSVKDINDNLKEEKRKNEELEVEFRNYLKNSQSDSQRIIGENTKVMSKLMILIDDKHKSHNQQQRDFNNSMLNEAKELNNNLRSIKK